MIIIFIKFIESVCISIVYVSIALKIEVRHVPIDFYVSHMDINPINENNNQSKLVVVGL
jgi:hypothetical protein